MLYRFLSSKKGFTMMEILIVVIILGILVGVAVPVYTGVLNTQKRNDCRNQRLVIETAVKQAMFGMIDNGRRQEKIYFDNCESEITYPGDGIEGSADDDYVGDSCFVLSYPEKGEGETKQMLPYIDGIDVFTLGDLRGGYRPIAQEDDPINGKDYKTGCEELNCFLKKKKLADIYFYKWLDNQEIPVCPFAELENSNAKKHYYYYVFEDGSVLCSCPECNKAD